MAKAQVKAQVKTPSKSIVKLATKLATKIATKLTSSTATKTAKAATKPVKPLVKAKAVKLAPKHEAPAKPTAQAKPEIVASKATERQPVLKLVKQDAAPAVLKAAASPKAKKPTKAAKADKSLMNLSERPLGELQKKWTEYKEKYGNEKAPVYNMANTYEAAAPLQHKVLGWGFVVSAQNDRLEVLFESGSKVLISNYRPG